MGPIQRITKKNRLRRLAWVGLVGWAATAMAAPPAEPLGDSSKRQSVLQQLQAQMDGAQQAWAHVLADAGMVYQPVRLGWRPASAEPASSPKPGSAPTRKTAASGGDGAGAEAPRPCADGNDWGGMRYCAEQHQVLMDMRYLDHWAQQASDDGDDARAYVLAHVLAHHVQNLLGVTDKLTQWQHGHSRRWRKDLHLRVELQADCLAGIWFQRAAPEADWSAPKQLEATMRRVANWHQDDVQGGGAHVGNMLLLGGAPLHVKWFQRGLRATGVEDCDTFIDEQL